MEMDIQRVVEHQETVIMVILFVQVGVNPAVQWK